MSPRFEFAFSCSPGEIRSFDLQAIREASIPLAIMNGTNKDCESKEARSDQELIPPTGRPRTHL